MALFVTGCGNNEDPEIYLVNPFTGPDGENFVAMVEEFNATNPEWPVRVVTMAGDAMYSLINSAYAAGQGIPDLMIVHADFVANYIADDMLVDWNEFLGPYPGVTANNYIESAWNIGTGPAGERFSIPLDVHSWVLYYNIDLMEQYGVTHVLDDGILTFDEVKEVGAIVAAADSNTVTYGITGAWLSFFSQYKQLGGVFTEDGINPTLYNDVSIQVLQTYIDLYQAGFTNEDGEDALQLFQTGQLMFLPEGVWFLNAANDIDNFEWGMTHTTQMNTDNIVNFTGSHQFVMFNSDERSDEKAAGIASFIEWVRNNSLEWARAGQNPASLQILDSDEYRAMAQSFLLETEVGRNSLVIDDYFYGGFVSGEIWRIFEDIVFGNLDLHEGLESAQRGLEDRIAQDIAGTD
jgi:multiple sugar transport system substrate-binding protein